MDGYSLFNAVKAKTTNENEPEIRLSDICRILKKEMPECEDTIVSSVSASLRQIKKNSVYFLFSEKVEDKARSAREATAMGACAIVCDIRIGNCPCIVVKDVSASFYAIGAFFSRKKKLVTIGITGSVGKSTAKEMTSIVLSQKMKTIKSDSEDITPFGVTNTVLSLPVGAEAVIYDMEAKTERLMSVSARIVRPDISVITNVGFSDGEYHESQEKALRNRLEILDGMDNDGFILLNYDDPMLAAVEIIGCHKVTYGINNNNVDFYADKIVSGDDTVSFNINYGIEYTTIKLNTFGEHNIYNAMIAFIIGYLNGTDPEKIAKSLLTYKTDAYQQQITGRLGVTLISDCCNSAPDSVKTAIQTLSAMNPNEDGRRIAVIADLLKMGDVAPELHRIVGRMLAEAKTDMVFCYGDYASYTAQEACAAGINATHFDTMTSLLEALVLNVRRNDIVMYKGCADMKLERLIQAAFIEPLAKRGSVYTSRYIPVGVSDFISDDVHANVALLYDINDNVTLFSKSAEKKINPGPTMNLLLCTLALEYGKPEDLVYVNESALSSVRGSKLSIQLETGENVLLRDLIYAGMVGNAPDAMNVIAEHIFGSLENALSFLNAKVKQLGCENTNLCVAHGYCRSDEHYSTASDMLKIATYALSNAKLREIAKAKSYTINPTNMYPEKREIITANSLLNPKKMAAFYPFATGLKSGKPGASGYTLAATAESRNRQLLLLMYESPAINGRTTAYTDAQNIFRYGFFNYEKLMNLTE